MNDLESKILYKCKKHLEDVTGIWREQGVLIDELKPGKQLVYLRSLVDQFDDAKKQIITSRSWLRQACAATGRKPMTSLEHYALKKVQQIIMENGEKMRKVDSKTFLQSMKVNCSGIHLRYYKGSEVNGHLSEASAWLHALLANKTELDSQD